MTLKELRGGMSQSKLAEKSGLPVRLIMAYDEGLINFDNASVRNMAKLAVALEKPISSLMIDPETRAVVQQYEKMVYEKLKAKESGGAFS